MAYNHDKLQSLVTISSTALVEYWDQLLQQLLLSTGSSLVSASSTASATSTAFA
jgi:hypothetical protein